jgi:cytochrome P450
MSTALIYDPLDPAMRADPYPTYRRMRAEEPVATSPLGIRVVTRYTDVATVLRSPHVSRNVEETATDLDAWALERKERMGAGHPSLLNLDPPDHTRLRGLVNKAFTPSAIERLRPRITELVDAALAPLGDGVGELDIVEALAFPVPFQVISDLLAMPTDDAVRDWSQAITLSLEPSASIADLDAARAAIDHLILYLIPIIEDRRAHPGDDVLSGLIAAEEAGDRLALEELISTIVLLYVAGHETTVNLIANGALALARHPDQLALWRAAGPSLDANAVDEILRFDGPIQHTIRVPLVDMDLGHGVLPAGHRVLTVLGAANHDDAMFDDPDALRLDRANANRHLGFAAGIHFCLGSSLARLEAQIALGTLVRRFAEWSVVGEPRWRDRLTIRGVEHLRLALA